MKTAETIAEEIFLKKYGNNITASESWVIRFTAEVAKEYASQAIDEAAKCAKEEDEDMLSDEILEIKSKLK